jgi:hypothetical protein
MSVARISGPQLLDVPLWSAQSAIDEEGVGIGCYLFAAILVAKPVSVLASVSPIPKTLFKLESAISTCCLLPP